MAPSFIRFCFPVLNFKFRKHAKAEPSRSWPVCISNSARRHFKMQDAPISRVHVRARTHACAQVHVSMCMCVCVCVRAHACVCARMHCVCARMSARTCAGARVRAHAPKRVRTRACARVGVRALLSCQSARARPVRTGPAGSHWPGRFVQALPVRTGLAKFPGLAEAQVARVARRSKRRVAPSRKALIKIPSR